LKVILAVVLLAISFAAQAKNPGESARRCVSAQPDGKGKVTFTNRCSEQIFVMWCGDLTYSKQRCGDAPDGGYYTHTDNVPAGQSRTTSVKGRFNYAACKGSVGFGKKGYWTDEPDGSYKCLPIGR
jgi:hypothetical protein